MCKAVRLHQEAAVRCVPAECVRLRSTGAGCRRCRAACAGEAHFPRALLWPCLSYCLLHPCSEAESWWGLKVNVLWLRGIKIHPVLGSVGCLERGCGTASPIGGTGGSSVRSCAMARLLSTAVGTTRRGKVTMTICISGLESIKLLFLASCFLWCV